MWGHAVWDSTGAQRNPSTRLRIPQGIQDLKLELADHPPLVSQNLGPLSGRYGHDNPVLHNYVNDLRSKRVITDKFRDFFPPDSNDYSYMQAFMVDLRSYAVRKQTTLRVSTTFEAATLCPQNLYLVSCFVVEGDLSRSPDKIWKMQSLTK